MGIPWSAQFPVVHVPQSAEPKRLTIVLPFYSNPQFLRTQINRWHTYAPHIKAHLSAIIVDDGSPVPASDVLRHLKQPFPIRLFRIFEDRRWNWLAARNIGAHEAAEGWLLLTDMDHVLPASTADALVYGAHEASTIYALSRIEHTGEPLAPHPNSWVVTRSLFWRIGGYDEALSGHYGTDGEWRRRCAHAAPLQVLSDRLIRYEYQGDSSTTTYLRKQPEDAEVKRIINCRGKKWKPRTLSFPYQEVTL